MKGAFQCLGLSARLVLEGAEIEKAFQAKAKSSHPDSGGNEKDFTTLRQSYEELKKPGGRLRCALAELGVENDPRGGIPEEVMNGFGKVAGALEASQNFLTARESAKSHLGRALLEAKLPEIKMRLEECLKEVEQMETDFVKRFHQFDSRGWEEMKEEMAITARGLLFLEKWRAELRAMTGKLFEVLLASGS